MAPSHENAFSPRPINRLRRYLIGSAGAVAVFAATIVVRSYMSDSAAVAQAPAGKPAAEGQPTRPGKPTHDVMAIVNGQDISRQMLAEACVERHGEEVLESLVNKRLIMHHCKNRQITVTRQEIDAEVERMAKRFKLSREHWLELLERERGIKAEEYARDVLWPTLALRKLAAEDLTVSEQELNKAYETQYGAAVRARLILVGNQQLAQQLHQQLTAQPQEFARLAMQHSEDVNSASIGGLIQPIRRHVGEPAIERAAFTLQTGQISAPIPLGDKFVLLKCEGPVEARQVDANEVREELTESIKESKLREVAGGLFAKLQETAVIQNVLNDRQLQQTMPGVVATVNGEKITTQELGQECMLRHGEAVLETEISHLLLEQALKRASAKVVQADIDAEIAHAAKLSGVVTPQGQPDLQKWVKMATEDQGVSYAQYIRDAVWPSVALKKLTSQEVEVTPDDLNKGFEANYGERVTCRAIVLGNMRRAQEVWEKARGNTSLDYFGDLAEEYSVEPTSKALRGEVPPIRRHGGQQQLEDVAFKLQPGELSGIVQMGDKFVVLKCEGRTKPVEVNPAAVRDVLHQDIYEKKLRVAMGERFEKIRSQSRIDNYLAGTSQAPPAKNAQAEPRRDTAVRPTSTAQPR